MFIASHLDSSNVCDIYSLPRAVKLEAFSLLDAVIPLRQRDEQILTELFRQEGIEAIEEDIACNLLCRHPEPCWEDDPFEFLREYL
jgi:hypothetical protein